MGTESDLVTISRFYLDELEEASAFLDALTAAGVDNWCGYDDAVDILEGFEEES